MEARLATKRMGIWGSEGAEAGNSPGIASPFRRLIAFWLGSSRHAVRRAVRSKIEGGVCALSGGQEANVSRSSSFADSHCDCLIVRGGKRNRGSETLKPKTAFTGRQDGFVSEPSESQALAVSSLSFIGFKAEKRVSVDPGPVSSRLPISNRKSSTITGGRCILATFNSSVHSCKKAEGWTRKKHLLFAILVVDVVASVLSADPG